MARPGPFNFTTPRQPGHLEAFSVAVVVDMGTMGPEGLSTTAGSGISKNNILKPGEQNTIQTIASALDEVEFLLHRKSPAKIVLSIELTCANSGRYRLCRCLGKRGERGIHERDNHICSKVTRPTNQFSTSTTIMTR